ncbi:hypothetical protein Rs2_11573 [Raphanus sativus]|nr:hypothetical protein Rs2_11573 [Raphanus sativus]
MTTKNSKWATAQQPESHRHFGNCSSGNHGEAQDQTRGRIYSVHATRVFTASTRSPPLQLVRLRRYTAGATPKNTSFVGAHKLSSLLMNPSPFSTAISSRRSFHRTSRSPPTLNRFKP